MEIGEEKEGLFGTTYTDYKLSSVAEWNRYSEFQINGNQLKYGDSSVTFNFSHSRKWTLDDTSFTSIMFILDEARIPESSIIITPT